MLPLSLLVAGALITHGATVASPDGRWRLEVPPGWSAMPPSGPADLFRLTGPLRYSAVVSRLDRTPYLYNRAAVSRSLERLLEHVLIAARVSTAPDPRLKHLSLANGWEVDYRLASPPERPALLLGLARRGDDVVLIQVIAAGPEETLRALLSGLQKPVAPPAPKSLDPPGAISMTTLLLLWLGSLAAVGVAMLYWLKQLRRPSRKARPPGRLAPRR